MDGLRRAACGASAATSFAISNAMEALEPKSHNTHFISHPLA